MKILSASIITMHKCYYNIIVRNVDCREIWWKLFLSDSYAWKAYIVHATHIIYDPYRWYRACKGVEGAAHVYEYIYKLNLPILCKWRHPFQITHAVRVDTNHARLWSVFYWRIIKWKIHINFDKGSRSCDVRWKIYAWMLYCQAQNSRMHKGNIYI